MKKKVVIFLTVLSIILVPIVGGPNVPSSPGITLFNHGEG